MTASSLKIIFAGTPEFAAVALQKLAQSPHQIVAVYTQPDRPAGRGLKLTPSAVKKTAEQFHLPVYQPASLKNETEQAQLKSFQADVMVVAAYGLILPKAVLEIPRFGCINIHPSLLPRWRGAAPLQRTIFAGDKISGVTIMQMDEGLDTGPMLLQHQYVLLENETTKTLHDKLAVMGADAMLETLDMIARNDIYPQVQDNQHALYANKISKEEARIDWHQSARELDCKIRAFNVWPVAYAAWQDQTIRIGMSTIKSTSSNRDIKPGTIVDASNKGIDVMTGEGVLTLTELQFPGGKMLPVADFYHARRDEFKTGNSFS